MTLSENSLKIERSTGKQDVVSSGPSDTTCRGISENTMYSH